MQKPNLLRGQGQARAYLQFTEDLPVLPNSSFQPFKYQAADTVFTMQVLESVVPGSAEGFIRDELLKPMGILNYGWQEDLSGLPQISSRFQFTVPRYDQDGFAYSPSGKMEGETTSA